MRCVGEDEDFYGYSKWSLEKDELQGIADGKLWKKLQMLKPVIKSMEML